MVRHHFGGREYPGSIPGAARPPDCGPHLCHQGTGWAPAWRRRRSPPIIERCCCCPSHSERAKSVASRLWTALVVAATSSVPRTSSSVRFMLPVLLSRVPISPGQLRRTWSGRLGCSRRSGHQDALQRSFVQPWHPGAGARPILCTVQVGPGLRPVPCSQLVDIHCSLSVQSGHWRRQKSLRQPL